MAYLPSLCIALRCYTPFSAVRSDQAKGNAAVSTWRIRLIAPVELRLRFFQASLVVLGMLSSGPSAPQTKEDRAARAPCCQAADAPSTSNTTGTGPWRRFRHLRSRRSLRIPVKWRPAEREQLGIMIASRHRFEATHGNNSRRFIFCTVRQLFEGVSPGCSWEPTCRGRAPLAPSSEFVGVQAHLHGISFALKDDLPGRALLHLAVRDVIVYFRRTGLTPPRRTTCYCASNSIGVCCGRRAGAG